MEQDEHVILQQRIRPTTATQEIWWRGGKECIGRAKREEEEERRHEKHDHERPRDEWVAESSAIATHDHVRVSREQQQPQQDAAL